MVIFWEMVCVVGLGNMGTALANILAQKGKVVAWDPLDEVLECITKYKENKLFLPGVKLKFEVAKDVDTATEEADLIFLALPSLYLDIAKRLKPKDGAILVTLTKGLKDELTPSEYISSLFENDVVVISGPSVATEFSRGMPAMVLVAGERAEDVRIVTETNNFKTIISYDRIGVEWCGILKNIYTVGFGIVAELGANLKGIFTAKVIDEMIKIVEDLGGRKETVLGVAGVGDFIATSLSQYSRNFKFGRLIAQGYTYEEAIDLIGTHPEGASSINTALKLCNTPRTMKAIHEVIHSGKTGDLVNALLL